MKSETSSQIEGFFLEFSGDEIDDVRHELEMRGYSPDGKGLKEALLDFLFADVDTPRQESATDSFVHKTQAYLKNNPEDLRRVIDLGIRLGASMFRKKKP